MGRPRPIHCRRGVVAAGWVAEIPPLPPDPADPADPAEAADPAAGADIRAPSGVPIGRYGPFWVRLR